MSRAVVLYPLKDLRDAVDVVDLHTADHFAVLHKMSVAVPEARDGMLREVYGPSTLQDLWLCCGEWGAEGTIAIHAEAAGGEPARCAVQGRD